MSWRDIDIDRDSKERDNGWPLCGQVRVLLVGDSGSGKTSLVHLIEKGSSINHPSPTIGCTVSVKHTTYGNPGRSSSSINGDSEREFFIELWDVSGHERYKDSRSLFYSQINGVIFVHDLSQRWTKTSLQKWAAEIAATGTFSAPLGSGGPGGLPVPYLVIGNKADIAAKDRIRGSRGNLVNAAREWVEKQGFLPSSDEIPLTESFPGSGGLIALIRKRYFSDDLPATNVWSAPIQRPSRLSTENLSDEDQLYKSTSTSESKGEGGMVTPIHDLKNSIVSLGNRTSTMFSLLYQLTENLTPPPTLYPQQPVLTPDNYNIPRFALTASQDVSSARSKRTNINV